MLLNGNIRLVASGHTEGSVAGNAYIPFVEVHMESGVFHNIGGTAQSGIFRYDPYQGKMQLSNDGGVTFENIAYGAAGGVTSLGVVGGADIVGAIDLSSTASGFIVIGDNGGSSPIYFNVDTLALSGLWRFPTQGFNGKVVNSVSVIGNTDISGDVNYQTVTSGFMSITQNAQNIQWQVDHLGLSGLWGFPTNGFSNIARCYTNTYGAASSWTINHALNTENVIVMLYDNSGNPLKLDADDIEITDADNVTATFNSSQAGKAVVMGF